MSNVEYIEEYLEQSGRTTAKLDEVRTDVFKTHTDFAYDLNMLTEAGVNADLIKRSLFYKEDIEKTRARGKEATLRIKEVYDKLKVAQLTEPDKLKFTDQQIDIIHGALGLYSEAGEIIEEVIASAMEQREVDLTNLEEEAGDVMWYVALILRSVGSSFVKAARKNIAKLFARYPDKFNSESALVRDLDAERQELEKQSA